MKEPSIKGVIVHGLIEEIRGHLENGAIQADELEARLEKEDLELFEEKLNLAGWYPIRAYTRIADLALELAGGSRREACIRSGERDARRMIDAGLYQQLDSLKRLSEAASKSTSEQRFQAMGRLLRLTMSLSKGIYSFSDWKVAVDPDHPRRYRVEVTGAEDLPEVIVVGTVGFLNECSRAARPEEPVEWSVEQPRPDVVIYRMDRSYA
jgi:hypothetical protein